MTSEPANHSPHHQPDTQQTQRATVDLSHHVHDYPDLTHTLSGTNNTNQHPTPTSITTKTPEALNFGAALLRPRALVALPLEKRTPLLGTWMKQGDLGYLFAPRGAGKSWMAMLIGNAVAEGLPLGEWAAGESPHQVIYFDAEMNLADVQDRTVKLGIESDNFQWLSNERLFLTGGKGVNIASPAHQEELSSVLPDRCFFIIDNLSTAQIGMAENDNDSFDAIRDWLLSLRHRAITVMIVHHAGRNGSMRGSSRREDMAHWIISLKDAGDNDEGLKVFTTTFEPPAGKSRNCPLSDVPCLRWTLKEVDGLMTVQCAVETGEDILLTHIAAGIGSATELAEVTGIPCATISRRAARLLNEGKIIKVGRKYHLAGGTE